MRKVFLTTEIAKALMVLMFKNLPVKEYDALRYMGAQLGVRIGRATSATLFR